MIADTWWHANKAAKAVSVIWDDEKYIVVSDRTIVDYLKDGLTTKSGLYEFRKEGDAAAVLNESNKIYISLIVLILNDNRCNIIHPDSPHIFGLIALITPIPVNHTEIFCI